MGNEWWKINQRNLYEFQLYIIKVEPESNITLRLLLFRGDSIDYSSCKKNSGCSSKITTRKDTSLFKS